MGMSPKGQQSGCQYWQTLSWRVQVEGIGMGEAALSRLGEIGESASLRHAVQLLTPAHVLAKRNGRCAAQPPLASCVDNNKRHGFSLHSRPDGANSRSLLVMAVSHAM